MGLVEALNAPVRLPGRHSTGFTTLTRQLAVAAPPHLGSRESSRKP
jgi:hypothetical protein